MRYGLVCHNPQCSPREPNDAESKTTTGTNINTTPEAAQFCVSSSEKTAPTASLALLERVGTTASEEGLGEAEDLSAT